MKKHGDNYTLVYQEVVVKKHIRELPKSVKNLVKKFIEERLVVDPFSFGKPLQYSLKGHRRFRVGDYRVVYKIDSKNKEIILIAIKHRKEIYDLFR